MQYLTKEIQEQYRSNQLCLPLRTVVLVLECLATLYQNKMPDGITITSLYRPDDKGSYHSVWRAVDIRNRDWTTTFTRVVGPVLSLIRQMDKCIQYEFESDHLHIEYDNNDPLVKGTK